MPLLLTKMPLWLKRSHVQIISFVQTLTISFVLRHLVAKCLGITGLSPSLRKVSLYMCGSAQTDTPTTLYRNLFLRNVVNVHLV